MVIRTRRYSFDGHGFTLLELLLTVALLIGLLAAVVYNFQSAQRGADLEEGARQFEALIRFAGAQAANSGKAVQFRFGDDAGSNSPSDTNSTTSASNGASNSFSNSVNDFASSDAVEDWGAKLHVVYEVDPVLQPGVFVNLPEAVSFVEAIGDRVRIEKVRMPERPMNQGTNDLAAAKESAGPRTATFFPDGSSESADIVLVSKEREDFRELIVHLDGVTGRIRKELKSADDLVPVEWMDDQNSSKRNQTSAANPQATAPTPPEKSIQSQPAPMPEDPAFEQPEKTKSEITKTNAFDDFP